MSASHHSGSSKDGPRRPISSLGIRPTTSLSHRGALGATANLPPRPASSLASRRPQSALLPARPGSSLSMRPSSRMSTRPSSRQLKSRLIPLFQELVANVTGFCEDGATKVEGTDGEEDGEENHDAKNFQLCVDYVLKNLDVATIMKAGAGMDMQAVDKQVDGHAFKAKVTNHDEVGEALSIAYRNLKGTMEGTDDLDAEIKNTHLPDHIQFLLALSSPPTRETDAYADYYLERAKNPELPPKPITWADILAEEPFEGEHWEGVYGMPPGTIRRENGEDYFSSGDSSPSLSPLSDELNFQEEDSFTSFTYERKLPEPTPLPPLESPHSIPPYTDVHRELFKEVEKGQYWRADWKSDIDTSRPFSLADASTLGPAMQYALPNQIDVAMNKQRFINEADAVRELLIALQGRANVLVDWRDGAFKVSEAAPRLAHLTLGAQCSIIDSFAQKATTAQQLRNFVTTIFTLSQNQATKEQRLNRSFNRRHRITRTLEAFADALHGELCSLDFWCSTKEQTLGCARMGMSNEKLVVSLLETEKSLRDRFEQSFEALLTVVRKSICPSLFRQTETETQTQTQTLYEHQVLLPEAHHTDWTRDLSTWPPSMVTASLLNLLFNSVQEQMERREQVTADTLMRVFVRTAEPVWAMIRKWMKDGMAQGTMTTFNAVNANNGHSNGASYGMSSIDELEDEFFIEFNGLDMGLLDPEFWEEGYGLREDVIGADGLAVLDRRTNRLRTAVPSFLEHVSELVLEAGKAIGLLKVLGISPIVAAKEISKWSTFEGLILAGCENTNGGGSEVKDGDEDDDGGAAGMTLTTRKGKGVISRKALFSVSIDTLSGMIYDWLLSPCQASGAQLTKVLVDDCLLWKHLHSLEDLYFMRRGDAISHFLDMLFAKMDAYLPWTDFHFLNTAFSDVVEASINAGVAKDWIQASLVRFSYRGTRTQERSIKDTVQALNGLLVEYAVPFPLTYIFGPRVITSYGEVFVFLVQVRRAKNVLERILVRGEVMKGLELKAFYAMRSRLSWFINTLLNHFTTYVIHRQVTKFHESLGKAQSLDEMIKTHNAHIDKLVGECLLKPHTSALHRAILSVLDISLHFTSFFIVYAGHLTTTHDVSRHAIPKQRRRRHHRSKRHRRQRKNVIGFSLPDTDEDEDDDDDDDSPSDDNDDDGDDQRQVPEASFSLSVTMDESMALSPEDFEKGLDKMAEELDGLVRYVRKGVEKLANGSVEATSTFGVLAFALEDWDN